MEVRPAPPTFSQPAPLFQTQCALPYGDARTTTATALLRSTRAATACATTARGTTAHNSNPNPNP
eukprot:scaffold29468_cov48-Phaeocystis_antarctica.AAC.1